MIRIDVVQPDDLVPQLEPALALLTPATVE